MESRKDRDGGNETNNQGRGEQGSYVKSSEGP